MKKFRNILVMLIGVFALSGCGIKNEINMNISSDGKMVISELTLVDADLVQSVMKNKGVGETPAEGTVATVESVKDYFFNNVADDAKIKENATKSGFMVEQYTDATHLGYKKSVTINNVDDVSDAVEVNYNLNNITDTETNVQTNKLLKKDGDTYTAKFMYDPNQIVNATEVKLTEEGTTPGTENPAGTVPGNNANYLNQITTKEYKYVVTLPVAATTHNATSVSDDKLTYTWDLDSANITNIEFTFTLAKSAPVTDDTTQNNNAFLSEDMMMYIGIGGIALVLIIVIAVVSSNKKKKKKIEESVEQTTNETVNTTVEQALENASAPVESNQTVIEGQPHFEQIEIGKPIEVSSERASEPVVPSMETPIQETTPVVEIPIQETTPVVETPVTEQSVNEVAQEVVVPVEVAVEAPAVDVTPVVESTPVQETPVESTPVQETPVMEMPVEPGAPIEQTPVEEKAPAMEMPAEIDAPVQSAPVVDMTPTMEMPAEPVMDIPTPVMPTEEVVEEKPTAPNFDETTTISFDNIPAVDQTIQSNETLETVTLEVPVVETQAQESVNEVTPEVIPTEVPVQETPVVDETPVFETPVAQTTTENNQ